MTTSDHDAAAPSTPGPATSVAATPVRVTSGRRARWWPFPIHPLLFAAYPVLFLFSENLTEVALGETFQPILRAAAIAIGITLVAGLLLRDVRRGGLVASALVVIWFTFGHLEDVVAPMGVSRDMLLGACLVGAVAVMVAAVLLRPTAIARLTTALDVIAVLLVILTLVNIVPYQLSRGTIAASGAGSTADRPAAAPGSRDIYFMIFDRYGNAEAMADVAGAEDALTPWLAEQGFVIAPHARANYGRTSLSLAATLGMRHLDEVVARMGVDSDDATPINDLLSDNAVGRFLQGHGYRFIQIGSWFAPTRTSRIADENPVLTSATDFGTLLDSTTLGPVVDELRGLEEPPKHHLLHRAAALFGFHELDRASAEPGPKFVFAHILLPHEPYVFAANGEYSGLSEADSKFSAAAQRDQLAYTNERIKGIVSSLLAVPEAERPIIIIESDEGPYPDRYLRDQQGFDWSTATDEELVTKYGVLTAMYLPGEASEDAPAPYPDMSVINTFPIVLDRYFDAGIELLPDTSYTSRSWTRPYDLTDITERLRILSP